MAFFNMASRNLRVTRDHISLSCLEIGTIVSSLVLCLVVVDAVDDFVDSSN